MDERQDTEIAKNRNGIHRVDMRLTTMESEWNTTKTWIKFLFGSSLAGTLVSLLTLLRLLEVI